VIFLQGIGQYGTRRKDGEVYASTRYTKLMLHHSLNRFFKRRSALSLQQKEVDGQKVEMEHFVASVMPYNPLEQPGKTHKCKVHPRDLKQLTKVYEQRIHRELQSFNKLHQYSKYLKPSYAASGWEGSIERMQNKDGSYAWLSRGVCSEIGYDDGNELYYAFVYALPIDGIGPRKPRPSDKASQSSHNYYNMLQKFYEDKKSSPARIYDFIEEHTEANVCFRMFMTEKQSAKYKIDRYKHLDLQRKLDEKNVSLLDEEGCVKQFDNIRELMEHHYKVTCQAYTDMKAKLLHNAHKEELIARNKANYAAYIYQNLNF